jgi:hypothetical protein
VSPVKYEQGIYIPEDGILPSVFCIFGIMEALMCGTRDVGPPFAYCTGAVPLAVDSTLVLHRLRRSFMSLFMKSTVKLL